MPTPQPCSLDHDSAATTPALAGGPYPEIAPSEGPFERTTRLLMQTLDEVSYEGMTFYAMHEGTHWHLRVSCSGGVCNVTGEPLDWNGRWWRISNYTTKQEIVGTAFKAVITAMEHEVREKFLYRNQAIYDGHMDVDLLALMRASSGGLDERAPAR